MILIVSSALWTILVLVDFDFPILMFFLTGLEGMIDVIRYYGSASTFSSFWIYFLEA